MYHHHSQQQGQQPFSNGPRPPHHQPPPNQHQNRSSSNMLSPVMGFQFPRPTQLPDELESALAIRGARDMDHRLIDHMNRPNQHQNQGSGSGQHGSYGSNQITLASDNQPGHQQGVDWSSYQPPAKLFANPPPSASNQSQRQQGPQQQPQSSHSGTSMPSWTAPVSESPSVQARHPHGGGSGGAADGQTLYTPESAGSILASFGLSNEDLEVLSHYPDDQLTPDTLPFILRDIQINKTGNQKPVASASSSSFSRSIHDMPPAPSRSSLTPEVPSLLTVTQTAGKVIDYGHASRAKDETSTRETFKRERLSSERTVKMYPASSSSSSAPKLDKVERRQVRLEHSDSSKHGDRDYRRTSNEHRKSNRSPGREFAPSAKSRNLDRDYRREGPKPRPASETKSEASSRRSLSSSSGSNPHSSSKKLPTPTMISDFSAVSPKVYPHTCSLCHTQCDQEKDWVDHINTVNHTAACRDLRNKYPAWKPNLPSRSGRYGSRALWDPKDGSPSHSLSRSLSGSPTPSPVHSKHLHRPHTGPYLPHSHPRHQPYAGGSSRGGLKRPYDDLTKVFTGTSRHPSFSKATHSSRHGPLQSSTKTVKSGTKPGSKVTKMSAKPPAAKKKRKIVNPASQDLAVADRLVYLTGIPKDASEQEVTDLVGSFGKINNVILMPCSEEERENGEGQKASVCMVKSEDAQALANSTNLSIREQQIAASIAKKSEAGPSPAAKNSKPAPGPDSSAAGEDKGAEADQKTPNEKGMVLLTGFPESDWSESDIIKLVEPFGNPSDIIQAKEIGKVLVSMPDTEMAQEMEKVHALIPAKIQDSELKTTRVKQHVGFSTPVALYNLLMGSVDPLESSVPVGWSSLVVINNVPSTPSGPSEVQKLVRRFGTVIKTLVLNNMVICEMATAAMALSVYKRFQMFPCIIHNNPLFFSRKADPKANTQTKVITTKIEASEDTLANGKTSQAAAADTAESAHKENTESPLEGIEKEVDGKDEKMTSTDKTVGEDVSKDDDVQTDELPVDSLAAPDTEPAADMETDAREISTVETVVETAEEEKAVNESTAGNDKSPAGEETKPPDSGIKAASLESAVPELPKVTQEMVNALLVECRTRSVGHPNNTAASASGDKGETQTETEQADKAAKEKKEPAKNHTEEEVKKERERKEKEARKEKEVRERERRAWEKEERSKRERERIERTRRERERREEERRERERRERKRPYTYSRSEGYKQSSWRDEPLSNPEVEPKTVEDEESDDFPFNMSDFVTVDEVGDVTDLPSSPSASVPMETTEGEDDTPLDTPMEVTTETTVDSTATTDEHVSESEPVPPVETSAVLVSSDFKVMAAASLSEASQGDVSPETEITPETEATLQADQDSTTVLNPLPAAAPSAPAAAPSAPAAAPSAPAAAPSAPAAAPSAPAAAPSAPAAAPSAPAAAPSAPAAAPSAPAAAPSAPAAAPSAPAATPSAPAAAPADSSSNGPATGVETSERDKQEKEDNAVKHSEPKKEEVVSDQTEELEKIKDEMDKDTDAPAVNTGKHQRSEDQAKAEEENVKKKLKSDTPMSSGCSLPPFDPSIPVGLEFLVPKTGFFCKVCNRFFSGTKEAERNHCKTLKHYENLQKYLQTTNPVTVKPDSV